MGWLSGSAARDSARSDRDVGQHMRRYFWDKYAECLVWIPALTYHDDIGLWPFQVYNVFDVSTDELSAAFGRHLEGPLNPLEVIARAAQG